MRKESVFIELVKWLAWATACIIITPCKMMRNWFLSLWIWQANIQLETTERSILNCSVSGNVFNVNFTESVARSTQLYVRYLLPSDFNGLTVYRWPSYGKIFGYFADESTTTRCSMGDIVELLKQISENGVNRLHVIDHNMKNGLIADALRRLVDEGFRNRFKFYLIILAASGIDGEVFVKDNLPRIVEDCINRVKLYVSKKVLAPQLSKMFPEYSPSLRNMP